MDSTILGLNRGSQGKWRLDYKPPPVATIPSYCGWIFRQGMELVQPEISIYKSAPISLRFSSLG
jgi:hypothetical protein